jgi:hypothetical protein
MWQIGNPSDPSSVILWTNRTAERCQYSAGAVENKSVDALYTVHGHPHRQDVVTMRKCKSNDNLLDSSRETCVPR